MSGFYVYCIGRPQPPSISEKVRGLDDIRVESFQAGPLAAAVSPAPSRVAVSRLNLLAHQRVVETLHAAGAVLPLRFGTVMKMSALELFLTSHLAELEPALDEIQDCSEISLRVWSSEEPECRAEPTVSAPAETARPGTAYLEARRSALLGPPLQRRRGEEISRRLSLLFHDLVRRTIVHPEPRPGLTASLSCLIQTSRLPEFSERLRDFRRSCPQLQVTATGPWPPYSFSGHIFDKRIFRVSST